MLLLWVYPMNSVPSGRVPADMRPSLLMCLSFLAALVVCGLSKISHVLLQPIYTCSAPFTTAHGQ